MNDCGVVLKRKSAWRQAPLGRAALLLVCLGILVVPGCGGGPKKTESFFTSGNREADQRASQRMAKAQQLASTGQGQAGGDKDSGQAPAKKTLFQRLGGEPGLTAIVNDFVPRAMQDPRVNWNRGGGDKPGFFGRLFHGAPAPPWKPTAQNVAALKQHMVQFFSLATGGPARYQGRDINAVHANMHITNPEFDAVVGDLKASLDKLQIADQEQKELLAIVESTRPQIVTVR